MGLAMTGQPSLENFNEVVDFTEYMGKRLKKLEKTLKDLEHSLTILRYNLMCAQDTIEVCLKSAEELLKRIQYEKPKEASGVV
jgi:inorganic pyrophosphatase